MTLRRGRSLYKLNLHLAFGGFMVLIWPFLMAINTAVYIEIILSRGATYRPEDTFVKIVFFVVIVVGLFLKPLPRRIKLFHLLKFGRIVSGTVLSQKPYIGDVGALEGLSLTEKYRSVEVAFSIDDKEYEFVQQTKTRRDDLLDVENCIVLYDPLHPTQALAFFPGSKIDEFIAVDEHTVCLDCWPVYILLIPGFIFIVINALFLLYGVLR